VRDVGRRAGEPNDCTKRHVQRWESGQSRTCRPVYRRALVDATGKPFAELGFDDRVVPRSGEPPRRAVLGGSVALMGLLAVAPCLDHAQAGRRVGREFVEAATARTVRFRRLDDHLGGADTYRLYATELESTASALEYAVYSESIGRGLAGIYGEQAQQAGFLAA
jgi:hypothetical protein